MTCFAFIIAITATFAVVTHEVSGQDCWWTGCQPSSWAVTGCQQYNRREQGQKACQVGGEAGNRYQCCTGSPSEGGEGEGEGEESEQTTPKPKRRRRPNRRNRRPRPRPRTGGAGRGSGSSVSFAQFGKAITSNQYPAPSREQYNNFKRYARTLGKIRSLEETAMALTQLLHESDGLKAKREYACAESNCPDNYRTPGCDMPSRFYYGRGYIQLTWCGNYKAASQAIFRDDRLVRDPDMVAKNDAIAWQTAFWYWGSRVHGQPGVAQGQFGATTKAINGKLECSSPGNPQAQKRFKIYGNVRRAFGLSGAGNPAGCA